jgi:5-methylcytosine-specific restriction endonuclease McrA
MDGSTSPETCLWCGKSVPARRRGPKPTARYCNDNCRNRAYYAARPDKAQEQRERNKERARMERATAPPRRPCASCGLPVHSSRATYCMAPDCRTVAREAEKARARASVKAKADANRAVAASRVRAIRAAYTAEQQALSRKYSVEYRKRVGYSDSKRAGDYRRRARIENATVEKFSAQDVYDRDGWTCGICHEPVEPALKYPAPLSVSLDHIVPVSLGGEHSRANTRCAHLVCNMRRGAARGEDPTELTQAS